MGKVKANVAYPQKFLPKGQELVAPGNSESKIEWAGEWASEWRLGNKRNCLEVCLRSSQI